MWEALPVEDGRIYMARRTNVELKGYWTRILDDFRESNSGITQYCQEHKVSKASLYKWSQQLGIPLKKQYAINELRQIDKEDVQSNATDKAPFSFIELNVSPPAVSPSLSVPVKFELLFSRQRCLKIEATSRWEDLVGMIKALVN